MLLLTDVAGFVEIGIGLCLTLHRGCRPVTREKDGLWIDDVEERPEALQHEALVSAGQIGTPHRSGEDDVTVEAQDRAGPDSRAITRRYRTRNEKQR